MKKNPLEKFEFIVNIRRDFCNLKKVQRDLCPAHIHAVQAGMIVKQQRNLFLPEDVNKLFASAEICKFL